MSDPNSPSNTPPEVSSLDDLIVKYDMGKLLQEARTELENASSNRELLGQQAIANFFNLEDPGNARN